MTKIETGSRAERETGSRAERETGSRAERETGSRAERETGSRASGFALFAVRWAERIDRMSELLGRGVSWLAFLMILIGAFNAVARYLGRYIGVNLASNAYLELQWYLFSLVFLLGAAYTLRQDAHVRVDVVYGRLAKKPQAWINLLGTLLFLLPFTVFGLWVSWPSVRNSWRILEVSSDPGGLPRYPIKTVILVAFALLILQGISEAIKAWRVLAGDDDVAREPKPSEEIGPRLRV